MGELIQLPLSSECGCFVPCWFLAPKVRQRSFPVHGGEGLKSRKRSVPSREIAQPQARLRGSRNGARQSPARNARGGSLSRQVRNINRRGWNVC